MASTDRDALVSLLHSTGWAGRKREDKWGMDADLFRLGGVEVDGKGRVVDLRLNSEELEGAFGPHRPTSISLLRY
ncbi:unnamed protein product, partial [Scytosiphon promiscuus]